MRKRPKILFISTGNPTRSQMAEGFLKNLADDDFEAFSVGIKSAAPSPQAVEVMKEVGIDITGRKPKTVGESLREHFAYVVSIADGSRERWPIFPFTTNITKWHEADPAAARDEKSDGLSAYRRVRDEIKPKVEALVQRLRRELAAPPLRRTA
jgi:arsenate reductase